MKYKTNVEIEALTPEELIKEKNFLLREKLFLLEEAAAWKASYQDLMLEMNSRLTTLEIELLIAEEDRLFGGLQNYDHLCRIH